MNYLRPINSKIKQTVTLVLQYNKEHLFKVKKCLRTPMKLLRHDLPPEYVKVILSAITPEFLELARPEGSSTISPMDAITTKRYSRIFDMLKITLDKQVAKEYSDNVLRFGYEYACAKAINPLIEAIVDIKGGCLQQHFIIQAFESDEKFRELFDGVNDSNIAHGFIDACTTLFSSAINDSNPKDPTVLFITALRGKYDHHRNLECAGQLKLFDEGKKYLFCAQMSKDIERYLGDFEAFSDPDVVDRRIPPDLQGKRLCP